MVSRTHFLTEFNLHLVDLTFVPKAHKGMQMALRGIDESLFLIIAPRLLNDVLARRASETNGLKDEGLVRFGIFLDERDSYRFRLPGHCSIIFTAEMYAIHFGCDLIKSKPMDAYFILTDSFASIEILKST
jgi:uncharacterized protein YegP (UPF0339 family)